MRAATVAAHGLAPEAGVGATELLAEAAGQLEHVTELDPRLESLAQRLEALRYESEDVAAELRGYLPRSRAVEDGAGRLEEVEERLALLARLERKHGGTIADVLAHAERCRARRDELENADSALEALEAELAQARAERDGLAARLGKARRSRAPKLAAGRARRASASWRWPTRASRSSCSPRPDGCGPRGADAIEMRIAANAGGPLGPLREVASGGELSRVMLALLSVAHAIPDPAKTAASGAGSTARLRRDRRRHRRAHRAGGRGAPAGAVGGTADPLHHPPAAGGGAGRAPLHDRQGRLGDAGDHHRERARRRRGRRRARPDARRRPEDRAANEHARELLRAA